MNSDGLVSTSELPSKRQPLKRKFSKKNFEAKVKNKLETGWSGSVA